MGFNSGFKGLNTRVSPGITPQEPGVGYH